MPVILGYRLGYKQWFHTFGSRKQQQRTWLPRFSLYIVFRLTLLYRQNVSLSPKTINNKTNLLDLHKKKQQSIVVLAENRWLSNPRSIFHPGELSFLLLAKASSFYLLLKKKSNKMICSSRKKKKHWRCYLIISSPERLSWNYEDVVRNRLPCQFLRGSTPPVSYEALPHFRYLIQPLHGRGREWRFTLRAVPFTDEHVFNLIKSLLIRL